MTDRMWEVLVFAGLILFREWRNRRWLRQDLEKRDQKADVRAGKVLTSIAENTEISAKAFTEANGVNHKFIQLHDRIDQHEDAFRTMLRALDELLPDRHQEEEEADGSTV